MGIEENISITVSCDEDSCGNTQEFGGETIEECYEAAKAKGWKFRLNRTTCACPCHEAREPDPYYDKVTYERPF